jgi:hypothetical protein
MWRLTMFLLCLFAALSGTPLRQAEAASDFARAVDEMAGEESVETVDGGVGDDSGETILKAGCALDFAGATTPLTTPTGFYQPPRPHLYAPSVGHGRSPDGKTSLPSGSPRQHVWLQCFLF